MNHLSNASTTTKDPPSISGSTEICAIIGDPIAHTLSPAVHNAAFRSLKMDLVYVPFRVRRNELGMAIEGFRSIGVIGINVTMPHKSRVLRFLDRIDDTAREIGAVNTVARKSTRLHGYNTDGKAAVTALSHLGSLSGRKALILGAGGAAKAIAYQLSETADSIVILNRTRSNGARLASKITKWNGIPSHSYVLSGTNLRREARRGNLLINTLPAHVFPRFGEILIEEKIAEGDMLVMDANYELKNDFLTEARNSGAKAIDGLEMLIEQASLSFKLWTGVDAPIDVMRKAAAEARAIR
jgi:shikimate dehydrogenase